MIRFDYNIQYYIKQKKHCLVFFILYVLFFIYSSVFFSKIYNYYLTRSLLYYDISIYYSFIIIILWFKFNLFQIRYSILIMITKKFQD